MQMAKHSYKLGAAQFCTFLACLATLSIITLACAKEAPKKPKGFTYIQQLAKTNGFRQIEVGVEAITLRSIWTTIAFTPDSRRVTMNGTTIWLNAPTRMVNGKWALTDIDADKTITPLLRPLDCLGHYGYKTIVLDPGHGGKDSGGVGLDTLLEKETALDIARKLRISLAGLGYKVHLTRETDIFIELQDRCELARAWKADLFISIHCNSSSSPHANGIESFALSLPGYPSTNAHGQKASDEVENPGNKNDLGNIVLGHEIQRSLIKTSGRVDRGLRRARFVVLKNAPCPAALVECGFLSNQEESKLLRDEAYLARISKALTYGIDNYVSKVRKARLIAADTP